MGYPRGSGSKKDRSIRFCFYSRRINAGTVSDSYRLPRMNNSIDSLGDLKGFNTLDTRFFIG